VFEGRAFFFYYLFLLSHFYLTRGDLKVFNMYIGGNGVWLAYHYVKCKKVDGNV
jgi:hypothetical protein